MKLQQLIFSPTGGTRSVSDSLASSLSGISTIHEITDLCVKADELQSPQVCETDLVLNAMPVYAGRIPPYAIRRLSQIASNHARAVVIAVYGNRHYDDALLELQRTATDLGYRVIAALAAIAEHSIVRAYGHGRPDDQDTEQLQAFGRQIVEKLMSGDDSLPTVPGNDPYKPLVECSHPMASQSCDRCGRCAKSCPAGAIPQDDPTQTNEAKCISCMRCVSVCPRQARSIGDAKLAMLADRLKAPCAIRKPNELFL